MTASTSLRDKRRVAHDGIQQAPQIVADHAQHLISRGKVIVRPRTFVGQVLVGLTAFTRQESDMFCALLSNNRVGGRALGQQHLVFAQSVLLDPFSIVRADRSGDGLTIRGRPRPGKHLVGARPRTADDGICRLIDRNHVFVERKVGPFTLDAKTLVSLSAL